MKQTRLPWMALLYLAWLVMLIFGLAVAVAAMLLPTGCQAVRSAPIGVDTMVADTTEPSGYIDRR
jgi:hypothetical protein